MKSSPERGGPSKLFFAKEKGYLLDGQGLAVAVKYTIDATQKPAHIDLTFSPLEVAGDTNKVIGVFEVSGDELKIALNEGKDAERPTALESKEGSRTILLVLKREPDMKEPDVTKDAEQKIRNARDRMISSNNLKQIGLAMHMYHDNYGKLPASAIYSKDGKPLLSWRVAILPYIEQEALYKEFHLDEPWDSEHNKKLLDRMPKVYGAKGNETHYRVFTGKSSAFESKEGQKFADFTDGLSNTIMIVEG